MAALAGSAAALANSSAACSAACRRMDIDDPPVIYGLETQARALCSIPALDDSLQFLVGTQGLRVENQVHLLTFDLDTNRVSKRCFGHGRSEIWWLSAAPHDPSLCATVDNDVSDGASGPSVAKRWRLWRIPQDAGASAETDDVSSPETLELACCPEPLDGQGEPRCVVFHPERPEAALVADGGLYHLALSATGARQIARVPDRDGRARLQFWSAVWNPHHGAQQLMLASDTALRAYDLRCPANESPAVVIDNAHANQVRCVDYNPNRQYYLASCGDDACIKFWDSRQAAAGPVKVLRHHRHWVYSVQFNPYHDQLLLSAGSDAKVVLSNNQSVSSEPTLGLGDADDTGAAELEELTGSRRTEDGVVCVCEEHEDSVYSAVWCAADPWVFASLSYDGRLVISHVPKAEKYRILL